MKILIIDDDASLAKLMAKYIKDLGEVNIITRDNISSQDGYSQMPLIQEVIEQIKKSDVILLDNYLSSSYSGSDLLPHCTGKKVIFISSSHISGLRCWTSKLSLVECPELAASLRQLIVQ